jgi:small subunit ribosomal protein S17
MPKKIIQGKVVKISGEQTVSMLVERKIMHPRYRKYVKKHKKYLIHDEKNEIKVNDIITAIECPPLSKRKVFRLNSIISSGHIEDTHDDNIEEGAKA